MTLDMYRKIKQMTTFSCTLAAAERNYPVRSMGSEAKKEKQE